MPVILLQISKMYMYTNIVNNEKLLIFIKIIGFKLSAPTKIRMINDRGVDKSTLDQKKMVFFIYICRMSCKKYKISNLDVKIRLPRILWKLLLGQLHSNIFAWF